MSARPLFEIASEIKKDWVKPNYAAKPYLDAMGSLTSVNDTYGWDSGKSIVIYFLCNANTYRTPKAKDLKLELKELLKTC